MFTTAIAFRGKDFVLVAADGNLERSYLSNVNDYNRIFHVEGNRLVAIIGQTPDTQNLADYIQRNLALQYYVNGNKQSTESVVHWLRRQLADGLRKRDGIFFEAQTLFCGVDEDKPKVFLLDYYGSLAENDYLAVGFGSNISLAILDKYWHTDMEFDEAVELMEKCVHAITKRFVFSSDHYNMEVCYRDRIEVVKGPKPFPPEE